MTDMYIRIALEMKRKKMTQADLSETLGCHSQNLLNKVKNGTVRIDKLKELTDVLGLNFMEVVELYK